MNALFDAADGSERNIVDLTQLGRQLDIADQDVSDAARYLEGEQLLKGIWPGGMHVPQAQLTHVGIVEIEEQRSEPTVPTRHFPSFNVINFHGDVVNSPIQQDSIGSTQTALYDYSSRDITEIKTFTTEMRNHLDALGLDSKAYSEAEAELATIETEARSPKPHHQYISTGLEALETILSGAATSAGATLLLEMLQHLPH